MEPKCISKEQLLDEITQLSKEISILKEDRNEQNKLEEVLDHERDLYQDLTNALPLGVYRLRVYHKKGTEAENWHRADNEPYLIEFVNDHFCDILNIDKQTFIKTPGILHDLIFENDKAKFVLKNVEANLNIRPFLWEGRFKCRGEIIWIHFESIPRVLENKDIIWTGILNDISDRRRDEEELKLKNKELQSLNAEKDKFLSIIAHDLKSPFNSIIGFSSILLEKVLQKDLASLQEYAEIIKSSSERAMNLLMNLMQWSQSQTGHMDFNPEHFDMVEIIDEIIQLFSHSALQKSIDVIKDIPADMPVCADKAMIGTVLRNLLSNALKFTNDGGTINIQAKIINNEVIVTVKDTGIGMEKSVMERIFHIDSSYSTPDTNGNKGTGLGLMLCKEFAEKHKGCIRIESEPGKGSAFHFTLPSAQSTQRTISR